jgi:outer membrane receptor for monomeric catechols
MQVVRTTVLNGSTDQFLEREEQNLPVTQLGARGQFDLPNDFEFNPFIRFVDSVPSGGASAYWDAQLQLAWRASDKLRLALNVNQALRDQHFEYRGDFLARPEANIERSVFMTIAYQY